MGPSTCSFSVAARPSQNSRGANGAAYNGVERRLPISRSSPTASARPSVKARCGRWQDAQDICPLRDRRVSKNSVCPSVTMSGRETSAASSAWPALAAVQLSGGLEGGGTAAHSDQAMPGSMDGAGQSEAGPEYLARRQAASHPPASRHGGWASCGVGDTCATQAPATSAAPRIRSGNRLAAIAPVPIDTCCGWS
ncbi:hypothetical protein D3C71_1399630 [compost metagenome]